MATAEQYLRRVRASADNLRREGWLTPEDARELVAEARARSVAFRDVKALALPPNSGPVTVTVGRDGGVWFTAGQGNYIGRFNADGTGLRQFPLPNANSAPRIIASGADGNVWFSEHNGNRIGRITPQGVLSEFSIPTPDSQPRAIALGADGNIWFGEFAAGKIGRITPTGCDHGVHDTHARQWTARAGRGALTATSGSRNSAPARSGASPRRA